MQGSGARATRGRCANGSMCVWERPWARVCVRANGSARVCERFGTCARTVRPVCANSSARVRERRAN
eukprot:10116455-Lingulodinium_polyedra.AAC.1